MQDINEILDKYTSSVLENINKENVTNIVDFLVHQGCDYCSDLLANYLDIFTFNIEDFKTKYDKLNKKYNNQFLILARKDTNLFEEFYTI
jgi:hypothetical protein